jgi:bifunctional oligoribonuclease and PAP phosphatase NrnA
LSRRLWCPRLAAMMVDSVTGKSGFEAVSVALRRAERVVVVGHTTPDVDCMGSMLGILAFFAGESGVTADVEPPRESGGSLDGCTTILGNRDGCTTRRRQSAAIELPPGTHPGRLDFLLNRVPVERADDRLRSSCDTVVVVDTALASRMNATEGWNPLAGGRTVVNVDHHVSNPNFGTVNWVEPNASSTSELVYRLLSVSGRPPDPWTASALYAGIFGDTVGFSLPNTTASALEAAADLVRAGADVGLVGEKLDRSRRKCDFDLLRIIYDHTQVADDGRIAYSRASYDEIVGSGCTAADIDDQVSVPRAIEGIYIAMLFTEGTPGRIRINIRGERGLSVLGLAQGLGGGGHHVAAGAIVHGSFDEVVARVLKESASYLYAQLEQTRAEASVGSGPE